MWPYDPNLTLLAVLISTCLYLLGRILYLEWRFPPHQRGRKGWPKETLQLGHGLEATKLKSHLREVRLNHAAQIHRHSIHKNYRAQLNASVRSSLRKLAFFRRDRADDAHLKS